MESSHVYQGAEECHSNESGWTMYIGSPTCDDDYEEDNLNSNNNNNNVNGDSYEEEEEENSDDDTDDSMASDASSGPSHRWVNGQIYSKNDKDSIVMMRGKNGYSDKNCSVSKYKTSKNPSSSVKNGGGEKDESVHSAKGAQKAAAKSHNKERRSCGFWKGKTGK